MNTNIHAHDSFIEQLGQQGDSELRTIIARARDILAAREEQRKKEAVAAIRQLAKEHGLDIAVRKPARKRGRPPKPKSA